MSGDLVPGLERPGASLQAQDAVFVCKWGSFVIGRKTIKKRI